MELIRIEPPEHWSYSDSGLSVGIRRCLALIGHQVREPQDTRGGKRLMEVPGNRVQALFINLSARVHPPLAVWRHYNNRSDGEDVIKELREVFRCQRCAWESLGRRSGAEFGNADVQLERLLPTALGQTA